MWDAIKRINRGTHGAIAEEKVLMLVPRGSVGPLFLSLLFFAYHYLGISLHSTPPSCAHPILRFLSVYCPKNVENIPFTPKLVPNVSLPPLDLSFYASPLPCMNVFLTLYLRFVIVAVLILSVCARSTAPCCTADVCTVLLVFFSCVFLMNGLAPFW